MELEALSGYRLGVERGTIYESWANTDLVEAGLIPDSNVFEYERMNEAISDLRNGRIDIVALDLQPAQVAVDSGEFKIVAEGLNRQNFGIAVPKGASELLTSLNQTLLDMKLDGTLRELSAQYTGLPVEAIQPEEVLQIGSRIEESPAARLFRQGLVREVQARRDARQQVLALHIGQAVGLVAVDPTHDFATQGADQLQQAEVVALQTGLFAEVIEGTQMIEDRAPVRGVGQLPLHEEEAQFEVAVVVE